MQRNRNTGQPDALSNSFEPSSMGLSGGAAGAEAETAALGQTHRARSWTASSLRLLLELDVL